MGARMKQYHLDNGYSKRSGVTLTCRLYRVSRGSLVKKRCVCRQLAPVHVQVSG